MYMHDLSWKRHSLLCTVEGDPLECLSSDPRKPNSDFIGTFCSVGMSVYAWHLILVLYLCHNLLAYAELFAYLLHVK